MTKILMIIIVSLIVSLGMTIHSNNKLEKKYENQVKITSQLTIANSKFEMIVKNKEKVIQEIQEENKNNQIKIVTVTREISELRNEEKKLNSELRKLMEKKENENYLNSVIPDDVLDRLHKITGNKDSGKP